MSLYLFNVLFPNSLNPLLNFFLNIGFCTSGCSARNGASNSARIRGVTARLSILSLSDVVLRRWISKSTSLLLSKLAVLTLLAKLAVLTLLDVRDRGASVSSGVFTGVRGCVVGVIGGDGVAKICRKN